jgi:hypothetical protein
VLFQRSAREAERFPTRPRRFTRRGAIEEEGAERSAPHGGMTERAASLA